jgi:hypothetical protein
VGLGTLRGGYPKGTPGMLGPVLIPDLPHEPVRSVSIRIRLPRPLRRIERHADQAHVRDDRPWEEMFVVEHCCSSLTAKSETALAC